MMEWAGETHPGTGPARDLLSFPMDPGVSGRDFISRLPDGEANCIRNTRGPEGLASFLDSPIPNDEIRSHMFQVCLSDLSRMDLLLAVMSWDAGLLTDNQVACGREKSAAGGYAVDCLPWEMTVRLRVSRVTWDQPDEVRECLVSAHWTTTRDTHSRSQPRKWGR